MQNNNTLLTLCHILKSEQCEYKKKIFELEIEVRELRREIMTLTMKANIRYCAKQRQLEYNEHFCSKRCYDELSCDI
jgi:hypothetical protein